MMEQEQGEKVGGFELKSNSSSVPVWPGTVDLEGIVENTTCLSPEQEARSEALSHARIVLEKRGAMNTVTPPSITDLITVAHFILNGSFEETEEL